MTEHTRDFSTQMNADADPAARRAFVGKWIARNQRRLAAGLGSTVLMLPLLAQAQAAADAVNALDIAGVQSATLNPDGSAQLTLINGQQVQVGASSVQVAADGTILISAAAAELVAEAAAGVAAASAGTGEVGLGGGAAAVGAIAGIGLAVAAGSGSTAPADPPSAPTPVLNAGTFSSASPRTTEEIFGPTFPDLETGDRVFVSFGPDGSEIEVTVNADGTIGFPAELDLSELQGAQTLSYRVSRADADEDDVTGSAEVVIDTIPPVITITTPIAGDDVLNAVEQGEDLVIEGTATSAEDGQEVTLTFNGVEYTATVADGAWSVTIPAADLAGLADGANVAITADVSDAAGNPAVQATATLATDFTAGITLDPITIETLNTFAGVTVAGTTTGVEEGRTVTLTFDGTDYTATVGADGAWSVDIPASVIDALADGDDVAISAAVSDMAGNTASDDTTSTTDFSTPALVITEPESGGVINAEAAGEALAVSGVALEGSEVTVTLNGVTRDVTAGADNTWSTSFDPADLPAADGDFTITAATTIGDTPITAPAVTLTLDTTPPVITIDPIAGDNVLNAAEQGEDLVISGTATGAEDGQQVRVSFAGETYRGPVSGEAWSVTVPADVLAGLDDGESYTIRANVSDAAGNPAVRASATLVTDFTAGIALDPVVIETLNQFTGVEVSGTTTSVEAGQEVLVNFNGADFTTTVGADGTWSVTIPADVIAALDDGTEVAVSAAVADAAGNQADADTSTTTDFSSPALVITAPEGGGFVNADAAAEGLAVSGSALEGQLVTVTLNGAVREVTAGSDNTWSTSFDPADLPAADGEFTITAATTIEGTSITAPAVTLTLDTTPPALTLDTAVTADGLALSGTASSDVDEVALSVGGQAFTAPVSGGTWSLTIASGDLPAAAPGATVTVAANASDRAGNPAPTASVDLTAASVAVEVPADGFVVGLNEFESGFTISGSSTGVAAGGTVAITIMDGPDDDEGFETSATVAADGTWSVTVPASDVQTAADQESFTLTASVQGSEYPAAATASVGISTDIPPQITADPIGEDGVLILSELGDTIDLSGTTRGVQQGQSVVIRDEDGAELGTATVGANGAWSTSVPAFPIGPGEVASLTFEVSNASGRAADIATQSVEAYVAGANMVYDRGQDGDVALFNVFSDLSKVAGGDVLTGVSFTVTYDPSVATLDLDYFDIPTALTSTSVQANRFNITGLDGLDDLSDGTFSFLGLSVQGFDNLATTRLMGFGLNVDDPSSVLEVRISSSSGSNEITTVEELGGSGGTTTVSGNWTSYFGTAGADTIVAASNDTLIRGRDGDDMIDVSATGVHTVIFEARSLANGFDTVTGFTLEGALADRFALAFDFFDQDVLRGDGNEFQVTDGGAVGANVGLLVFTTAVADFSNATIEAALGGLTGLEAGDDVFLLIGDGTDAELTAITFDGTDLSVATGSGTSYARFEAIGDLSGFSAANILGFEQHNA